MVRRYYQRPLMMEAEPRMPTSPVTMLTERPGSVRFPIANVPNARRGLLIENELEMVS